ncbi:MAG: hypothetical protein JST26_12130 [Bacteroidetes bacterium]|nr:hypothetical protein [Bacteroidota bacterium]
MAPEIQQLIDDRKKLEVFFSNGSNWSVQFIQNDTIIREDYLSVEKVDNDLYFRVNNYELFLISNIQFPDNESIRFVKTRIDQHIPVLNNEDSTEVTLSYKSDNSFYGHEKNILVIYRPASGYGLNNLAIPITYKS